MAGEALALIDGLWGFGELLSGLLDVAKIRLTEGAMLATTGS